MLNVLGEVLAPAIAIAASPFTIIPAILLLLTPRAAAASGAFLVGWLVGLATAVTGFVLLASVIELSDATPAWASWLRIVLGAALVALGVRTWLQRQAQKPAPAWMRGIDTMSPGRAFGFALLLAVANPKVLALAAAGGLSIGSSDLTAGAAAVSVLAFTLVASLGVAVPVLLYLVLGERMLSPLRRSRDWLERNNASVMAVVLVCIGLVLLAEGVRSWS